MRVYASAASEKTAEQHLQQGAAIKTKAHMKPYRSFQPAVAGLSRGLTTSYQAGGKNQAVNAGSAGNADAVSMQFDAILHEI